MNQLELAPLYGPDGDVRSLVVLDGDARAARDSQITFGTGGGSATAISNAWQKLLDTSPEYRDVQNRVTRPYLQHAWVYAGISAVSNRVRAVPFGPWEGKRGTRAVMRSETPDRISTLFERPNPESIWSTFAAFHVINRKAFGEALWLCLRNGVPTRIQDATEIWHLCAREWGASVNPQTHLIESWKFMGSGEPMELPADAVVQFKNPNPYNAYRGVSELEAAGLSIQTDLLFKVANRAFVESGFNLGGVLTGEEWGQNHIEAVRQTLKDRHAGSAKQGNILVLGGSKIVYTPNQQTHRAMQYVEGLGWNRSEILAVLGVPEGWVSMGSGYNFATMSADDVCGWTRACVPLMREIDDVLWDRYFKQQGGGQRSRWIQFDYESIPALAQANLTGKLEAAKGLQALGYPVNIINERLELGMPDVAWGNEAYTNQATLTLQSVADGENLPSMDPINAADGFVNAATPDAALAAAKEPRAALPEGPRFSAPKRLALWKHFDAKVLEPNQNKMAKGVRDYFMDLRGDVIGRFRSVTGYEGPRGARGATRQLTVDDIARILFARSEWDAKLIATAKPFYQAVVSGTAEQLAKELGALSFFKESDPSITALLERRGAELVTVNETTQEGIRLALTEGSAANDDLKALASRINEVFNYANSRRSLLIARTEMGAAASGTRFAIMQAEGTDEHVWTTNGGPNVSDGVNSHRNHLAMDGEIRKVGMPFSNGLRHPLDPAGPVEEIAECNCQAFAVPKAP